MKSTSSEEYTGGKNLTHPYFPQSIILPGYTGSDRSTIALLAIFAVLSLSLLSCAYRFVSSVRPELRSKETFCVLWFIFTGSLHLGFEGYFVLNHAHIASLNDIFASLWKEYAKSDSRYVAEDTLVLCLETITVLVWGPLSYLTALSIIYDSPFRYPLQSLVSTAHLYGDVLYYATSLYDHYAKNLTYCRPEKYYFWVYYFAMNFIWIVVPAYLFHESIQATAFAFRTLELQRSKKKLL